MSFITNITKTVDENENFRKVIFTGTKSQLVVMNILPKGEIGEEVHLYVEQTLFFRSGMGQAIVDGKAQAVSAGDILVVTPGTRHNVINTGTDALKIFTIYAPANHIDGRIQATKSIADDDIEDEAFGEAVR